MIDLLYIVSQKIKMYMGMGIGKFIFIEKNISQVVKVQESINLHSI